MPGDRPPAVFAGYAEQHLDDDPTFATARARTCAAGRCCSAAPSTSGCPPPTFTLDASPGRHVAVLGTSRGRRRRPARRRASAWPASTRPGRAEFLLAGLVAVADDAADAAAEAVRAAGHRCSEVELTGLRDALSRLSRPAGAMTGDLVADFEADLAGEAPGGQGPPEATYIVVWGADAAGSALRSARDPKTGNTGLEDLRTILQDGPARGVHLLGWWRGVRRFSDDLGSSGRDDVAGLVALNVPAKDLGSLIGNYLLDWQPRPNRALFIDQHEDRTALIVPFVRSTGVDGQPR